MKRLILALIFAGTCALAQLPPLAPSLEQIKIAADAGDPAAQDKLAENFILRMNTAQAELWYRKAAAQGYAHAQGQLGNMLLMRSRMTIGLKPDARAAIATEAVRWMTLAANQGDSQGQANLADVYLEGKLVKQDLIEAYKWGDLAAQGAIYQVPTTIGRSTRDAAILKMNANQIAEARQRVAAFTPHQPGKDELFDPLVQKIKLTGISGAEGKRLAVIGNRTFAKGEHETIKIDQQSVAVQCLEITATSATIAIEGLAGTRTLNLK